VGEEGDVAAEMDPRDLLLELARFVVTDAPLPDLMQRIATTARDTIAPVADASVTFTRGNSEGWTVATTGELATRLDEAQYAMGHGPCMDAGSGGEFLLVRDFSEDERWPDYNPIALEAGARSSLSVPFPIQQHVIAALNLYSRDVDAFSGDDIARAEEIAAVGAVAVTNATLYESATELSAQLREAMTSRAVIEQAKGIVMASTRCTPDQAFEVLVKASQRENRKLRDIAADIVARHSAPAT
jgi:GAF domain-containing protein